MLGRKVRLTYHGTEGVVENWEPLISGMCDVTLLCDNGKRLACASNNLTPIDGLGPLPSRQEAIAKAKAAAVMSLRAIREAHVRDWNKPWPGAEFGKAVVGRCLDEAIKELKS